jgi:hypothetical protein
MKLIKTPLFIAVLTLLLFCLNLFPDTNCQTKGTIIKSDIKIEIKKLADDGAWLWFNGQNVIVDGNNIYIGCEDSHGYSVVNQYQLNSADSTNTYRVYPLSTWSKKDDHNYPSLLKLKNGKLLATYSRSPSLKMNYRIAEILNKGTEQQSLLWGEEQSAGLQSRMSYNNLISLSKENSCVFNFFTMFNESPSIIKSDSDVTNWSEDFKFMKQGKNDTSPYVKYANNEIDRVDILYTDGHPRKELKNNVYHIYYKDGNFYKSDGSMIRSLKEARNNPISTEEGTKIYDGSTKGPGWVWDIEYNSEHNPVAVYISSADNEVGNDLRYHYAEWDDNAKHWTEQEIAYAGSHLYVPENHFAGGIAIDPENTNMVYISSNVNPVNGGKNLTGRYQIYRGTRTGDNWEWTQLTFNSNIDNLRPIVPQHHGSVVSVVWFRGIYNTSIDFKTEVVGILDR